MAVPRNRQTTNNRYFHWFAVFAAKPQTVVTSWDERINNSAKGKFSQRWTSRPPRLPSKPTSKCFKDMETISLAKLLASKTCFRKKTFATFSFFSGRSNFNGWRRYFSSTAMLSNDIVSQRSTREWMRNTIFEGAFMMVGWFQWTI